ncbi:MAG: NFACT RNA binding domain-containing protein, partial [Acidobacteria bacterium]|nr:NFACT RNA binding domain-containing protein [Acidobacteriota bacterium]
KQADKFTGARRYVSSDGFEILVGKGAKDNDFLTFRMAKSSDLWLHAADYPGSHVVVKNPNRTEIPQKTLIEAAQIAAFFSQAKTQAKVAVHYTQKKFVNKPKGAVAGLVSLASFKTILVEPKIMKSE